ncbi:MAG: histidine phosphatase family protein, partial [Ghiorsea sp.]|nr:histidine phosphatase family protein [Ghiorsea sp.]
MGFVIAVVVMLVIMAVIVRTVQNNLGAGFRAMKISIDRVWSSPLVRARETASLLARGFGWQGAVEETDALGYDCTVGRVRTLLADGPVDGTVVCVG